MADNGVVCSMSCSGNVWDNAAMESFFSSLKTERIGKRVYRTRDDARADVFDYIERFYNIVRRHSTIGYVSPVEFERKVGLAQLPVHETGSRPERQISCCRPTRRADRACTLFFVNALSRQKSSDQRQATRKTSSTGRRQSRHCVNIWPTRRLVASATAGVIVAPCSND